jgi:hypothetical protein
MSYWYYGENDKTIGPVSGRDLQQLVRQGAITSNTRIENESGQIALASKVRGLPFGEKGQSESSVMLPPTAMVPNPFAFPLSVVRQRILESVPRRSFREKIVVTIKSFLSLIASLVTLVLVLLLCGVVGLVLLNVFYMTQPNSNPPQWLDPVMFLNRQVPVGN